MRVRSSASRAWTAPVSMRCGWPLHSSGVSCQLALLYFAVNQLGNVILNMITN
jgi:hypothetical protein